jgi:rhamnosyltransferase
MPMPPDATPPMPIAPFAPPVSIVLLTLNGMPEIEHTLDMIARQCYEGPMEVVHIDSGSTDETLGLTRHHGIATHSIAPADFHHGRTRNLGASMAGHEIVVFISQDAVPATEHWLAQLVAPFADARVAAVHGRQIAPPGTGPLRTYAMEWTYGAQREERRLEDIPRLTIGSYRFSNANAAFRRGHVCRIRFDEIAPMCEDQAMCRALLHEGFTVVYEPAAAVYHAHERSFWEEFTWAADNGVALRRIGLLGDPRLQGEFRYGLRRMIDEFGHFMLRGRPILAGRSVAINIAKWLGVQLGKREHQLPRGLMRRVSPIIQRETAQE